LTAEVNEDITSLTAARNNSPFTMQEFVLADLKNANLELHLIAYLLPQQLLVRALSLRASLPSISSRQPNTSLHLKRLYNGGWVSMRIGENGAFEGDALIMHDSACRLYARTSPLYRTDACMNEAEYKEKVGDKMNKDASDVPGLGCRVHGTGFVAQLIIGARVCISAYVR
jgi:hypothetical protein